MSIASARVETRTHSILLQRRLRAPTTLKSLPPTWTAVPLGTWLRKATRGFSGPLEIAKPTSTAISTG